MQNTITITPASDKFREAILSLLQSEKLPVEDLATNLPNFFIATDNGFVIGAVGLEIYGRDGLLRSLVVKPEYRKMKIAARLVNEIESMGRSFGLNNIYLLTETAQHYFSGKGFQAIDRKDAPVLLQQSPEFSHVCPSSAVLMKKKL